MACKKYLSAGEPDSFAESDKCLQQADVFAQCGCLEDEISSILGPPELPQFLWGICGIYYEYNLSDVCSAYQNGSNFNYTAKCTTTCYPPLTLNNPCSQFAGKKSLNFGSFETDKNQLADNHGQAVLNKYYSDIQPKENKLVSEFCLFELQAEVDLANQNPNIIKGCEAPYVIIEEGPYNENFTTNTSLKCLSCQSNQTLPYLTFKKEKGPEWVAPDPFPEDCSPPPPPSPSPSPGSPTPPPPPPPTPGCINGGWTPVVPFIGFD